MLIQVVIHPEAPHGVMDRRINPHGGFIRVLAGDFLVHMKKVAVPFPDNLLSEALYRIGKIQVHPEPALAHAPAFIANMLRLTG